MRILETAAGAPPLVKVRHIVSLIDQLRLEDEVVGRAIAVAGRQAGRRHRAGDDALWLQHLLRELIQQDREGRADQRPLAA